MKTLYEGVSTTVGGRAGHATTDDGKLDLKLSVPKAMGGDDGPGTNSEQLFGCAYSACFGSAIAVIAKKKRIELSDDFSVTATIGFCEDEDGAFLEATLDCYIPGVDVETGEDIIKKAHKICPFSKATRDNITVNLNLLLDE
ncbi:Ohr subfamily peroxiredoxin [Ulvibacter sp. MAR_2010_11]|uniref:organic hydroperoxide resistance protein n=1 Tax=Ulvibacter sp. MAR_2010_11 TaxID=1250229 RepID=UPI000C2BF0C7|nr:organic hydroperoxide resistance protein [Ulvibacter sp. MAR_2010_11]PKA82166.1 Ohr subfamily peroxiredoxin [Ulvibacter sp. MAR_2010_11]